MCRLLGIIASKPVDLAFSQKRFKNYAVSNPDGWGIGWYKGEEPEIFKEALSAGDEKSKLPYLSKEVTSNIIIAHVRKGTKGKPAVNNSHPFKYKNWLFAHNGSVNRDFLFSLLKKEHKDAIKGETDSEVYFYWILQCIEEYGNILHGLREAISKVISKKHSGLNFLLSNGNCLYAFRYSRSSQHYYSLYKLRREPTDRAPVDFLSRETQALLSSKSLRSEKAVFVCSEKLTEESWEEVAVGGLLTISADLNRKSSEEIITRK